MHKFNDKIIKEGFPSGWFIQDRLDENVALLITETPGMWPGTTCVCLRPKAIKTSEWLPTARMIAHALAKTKEARVKPLEWEHVAANIITADGYMISAKGKLYRLTWHDGHIPVLLGEHEDRPSAENHANRHREQRIRDALA